MDWEDFYNSFRKPDFIPGYEIQNRLGGGAFGDVYKGRKQSIGKAYAIKFLKIEDDAQRDAVERELSQVRHFAAIDHPNLVTIEDMGTAKGVPYLIMGYAGEDTLARRLKNGALDAEQALLYFVQACRGVLALHDRRLVHFDIKPSNIFLRGEVARVGDYGLSKLLTDGRMTLSFGRGTPQYMAPEMLRSRADHRADIYSLGVVLYESLTGELPYATDQAGGLVLREKDDPPEFPPDFPNALRGPVSVCLKLDPDDRYPTVSRLLEALGQTARQEDAVLPDWSLPEDASAASERQPDSGAGSGSDATGTELAVIAEADDSVDPLRQNAADFARNAVEVAKGVWDGLRSPPKSDADDGSSSSAEAQSAERSSSTQEKMRAELARMRAEEAPGGKAPAVPGVVQSAEHLASEVGRVVNDKSQALSKVREVRDRARDKAKGVIEAVSARRRARKDARRDRRADDAGSSQLTFAEEAPTVQVRSSPYIVDDQVHTADSSTAGELKAAALAAVGARASDVAVGRGGGEEGRAAYPSATLPARAAVPVPPAVGGGLLGSLIATTLVGMEVVAALLGGFTRGSVGAVRALSDRLLRGSGNLMARALRMVLFITAMVALGAVLTMMFLLFLNAVGAN